MCVLYSQNEVLLRDKKIIETDLVANSRRLREEVRINEFASFVE